MRERLEYIRFTGRVMLPNKALGFEVKAQDWDLHVCNEWVSVAFKPERNISLTYCYPVHVVAFMQLAETNEEKQLREVRHSKGEGFPELNEFIGATVEKKKRGRPPKKAE